MNIFIISGGTIEDSWALEYIEKNKDAAHDHLIIAADRGVEFLQRNKRVPDYIIGDFDSASETAKQALEEWQVPVTTLPTHKDDTDTEAAVALAFMLLENPNRESAASDEIHILGGTGTRLDHVLGNISVLGQGLEKNVPIFLVDPHNRIRMIDKTHPLKLSSEEQYGKYISSVPFTTRAGGVNMKNMEYPLTDFVLEGFTSLGISNEIKTGCIGEITVDSGTLIVIESRD